MPDYIDFLLYGSLQSSDSYDCDYFPARDSQDSSSQYSSSQDSSSQYSSSQDSSQDFCSQDLVDEETLLKLYHNYYIYMGYSNGLLESEVKGGSGERGEQGLPGIGFKLTDDGNFDIDGKRLTDVSQQVNGGDATTKAYVDREIGHHTGNIYHLRQSFTFYDSSGTELALSTDSITGLVTDYKHGYYNIPKSGDDNYFSTLDIKIRNHLPKSIYSALVYLYGYRNNRKMSGVDLGPILFDVDGTNYNILKYDDDDNTETTDHTKAIIWFTADGSAQSPHSCYNGSIELGLRFFDKSITHFVILSRCVEGKVDLGFSSNIFNVSSTVGDVTLYFEDIIMNSRKIKNLGGPTGDGDVTKTNMLM